MKLIWTGFSIVTAMCFQPLAFAQQLDQNCTVSILNRNITAQPDGTWVIPNIPANQGRVRARATCVENGITRSGQSDLFLVPANGAVNVMPIQFGSVSPIPTDITLSLSSSGLVSTGATAQITTQATYPDGTTANVTSASAGTDYSSSTPQVATVSADGLITGVSDGSALITAFNEGTSGFLIVIVGGPPTATITSPVNGATVIRGATLPVVVQVTGQIAAVSLLANGQTVETLTFSPYQFNYVVPSDVSAITLVATATDVSGNVANSQPVTIATIVDPLTTVVGSVVNTSGTAVSGASVSCEGVSGLSGSNGSFSIPHVPTAQNVVVCSASFTNSSGVTLSGSSLPVPPVRAGITDAGQIIIGSLSSRGTDFWMAFQKYSEGTGARLTVISETTAHFTVTAPGFSTTGTVTPQAAQLITLPNNLQITGNQTATAGGIHLTSDAEISATFFYNQDGTHDAYLAIPTGALGKEYFAASYLTTGQFAITAAVNNTNVSVTPACDSVSGTKAGSTFSIALNQGQTYQYECAGDVTGSHIVSNQPVSVVAGNACAYIPTGSATCDVTSEMMFPVASLYGTDFYPVAFLDTAVRIVAARDNTSVTVDDGISTTTYSLNSGQFKEIQSTTLGLAAYHVTSDNPVTVLQFGGEISIPNANQQFGGPDSIQILPTAAFKTQYQLLAQETAALANFVIIVAPNSAISSIQLNGVPLSQTTFFPLPGGLYQWTFYPVLAQSLFTANAPIGVYSIGFGIQPTGSFAFPVAF